MAGGGHSASAGRRRLEQSGTVTAVCIGRRRQMPGKDGFTGIYKNPVEGAVAVGELGLEGDFLNYAQGQRVLERAVYVFSGADCDWWGRQLGRGLEPGTLGENLRIDSIDSQDIRADDVLVLPDLVLQATIPRTPCATLATRMEDKDIGRTMMESGHPGFFCRVLEAGTVEAGQQVRVERVDDSQRRVVDMMQG